MEVSTASVGSGFSVHPDPRAGALEAAGTARAQLRGAPCDLAVVFVAGAHLSAPADALAAVQETLAPAALVGCGAAGVIAQRREVEQGTAISVWAASFGEAAEVQSFHASVEEVEEGRGALEGMPDLAGADGVVLLGDPATFPTDAVLRYLSKAAPIVPVTGGLASGRTPDDEVVLFCDDDVHHEGAVGVRLDGVEMLPCVSQGAAPLGPELTITAGEGHVISELAGKPALQKLRETIDELEPDDLRLIRGGLLMGIVVDANKPEYVQGDFLVRGLVGADPDTGQIAVAADVHPGQVVRLHARDAESADRDLREELAVRMAALGGRPPAGALVFACESRGAGMFGTPDHDAETVNEALSTAPVAGFFAGGEIGPVGGESFLHGFTATIAIFA